MSKINKKNLKYSAIFEPAIEGGYNVSFPQFPGCVTFGQTFEEAKIKAHEILELWLKELVCKGEKIPTFFAHPIIDEVQTVVLSKAKFVYASNNC